MARKAPTCFTTRDEFSEMIGVVNAEISRPRTSLRYATKYHLLAREIAFKAERLGMKVLHTVTDDGLNVVTIKGFGSKTWRVS